MAKKEESNIAVKINADSNNGPIIVGTAIGNQQVSNVNNLVRFSFFDNIFYFAYNISPIMLVKALL